jgi:WD40 repeat protein/DNA-binding CsgD family transcriptional regulator/transcriptional regulator with XRE-family HTH domain
MLPHIDSLCFALVDHAEGRPPVKRYSYGERDYAFGQLMLTLRTTIGLTQAGLADQLGVSRRTVAEWEAGSSYPKAERLKQLIALGMQASAFPAGREEEEIRALWKAAHQKVLLDEAWLADLLAPAASVQPSPPAAPPAAPAYTEPAAFRRVDWVGALDTSHFTGREVEVAELSQWILQEHCRLVTLVGMGGIGKSMLASSLGFRLAPQFEAVLWRSVRDAPPCEELVADCLTFFSQTPPAAFPASLEQRINQLVARLQASRCLLVLDNLESLLVSGDPEGNYLPSYEGYGRLIGRLAEATHQSCVLLTSREKPREIEALEGLRSPVRTLRLSGLDEQTARDLLGDKGLVGTPVAWQRLVAGYAGNPLALKIVGQAVSDLFGGDLDRFLHEEELVFNGVRPVLRQQVGRLSALEHLLLTWLAVLREWTELPSLLQVLSPRVLRAPLLEALEALRRRALVERGQQASFSLQSVVMEYLTDELGEHMCEEIVQGHPQHLRRVALEQAQAKDYVREIQVRLLVHPLALRLRAELGADSRVEAHLLRLLSQFRAEDMATQGYGPANVITLLTALRGHLRGLDLSRLAIRGAYLQGVEMQDATLSGARLEESVLTEAFDAIWAVAISQSGQYWAAADRRGDVRLWRGAGETLHRVWPAHTDNVVCLAFSPDERLLASGSNDDSVKLWDVERGAPLWSAGQTSTIACLAFAPDGGLLAGGGLDGKLRLWDAQQGTLLEEVPHPGPVFSLAWLPVPQTGHPVWGTGNPDGHLLATGDGTGTLRLWEIGPSRRASCVESLTGHSSWVCGLAFAPDGSLLASGGYDGIVNLWELGEAGSLRLRQRLAGHTQQVECLAWSPDGGTLASGSFDHTIRLWEAKPGLTRVVLLGHSAMVADLAFTPDSRSLLSGSVDGTLRLWELERGQCVRVLQGFDACLYDLAWSPDGTRLASASAESVVSLWQVQDLGAGARPRVLRGHGGTVFGVAWRPDGSVLASAGWDNAIRLWDAATGSCLQVIFDREHSDTLFHGLAWSPDGKRLASATPAHGVLVWEGTAGETRWMGRELPIWIRRLTWSPDGTRLVGGAEDGHVYVWDVSDGRLLERWEGHQGAVTSVAFSPDGKRLASVGGSELLVWEVQRGARMRALGPHPGKVNAVTWEPSGERLLSGSSDGRLRRWEVQSGACVRVQEAHQGTVQALKVSPEGRRLASCGNDGTIRLWDLESGQALGTLRRDRPYERLNITGIRGLTEAQKASLRALGAIEERGVPLTAEQAIAASSTQNRTSNPPGPAQGRPAQTSVAQPLPDPLSQRELEVLHLLAGGASNQEIAVALVLAPGTVKLHVSHILSKLGVNSRTRAILRARDLGLLPDAHTVS